MRVDHVVEELGHRCETFVAPTARVLVDGDQRRRRRAHTNCLVRMSADLSAKHRSNPSKPRTTSSYGVSGRPVPGELVGRFRGELDAVAAAGPGFFEGAAGLVHELG